MGRRRRTKSELIDELRDQIDALAASCFGYDVGNSWEAKRIATSLYTLLYDGQGRTKSLLGQLGLLSKIEFTSSAKEILSPTVPFALVVINATKRTFNPHWSWFPETGGMPPWSRELSFQEWWSEVIFLTEDEKPLTRKNLVLSMRSQDGGAHYDESLTEGAYQEFRDYLGKEVSQKLRELTQKSNTPTKVYSQINSLTEITKARDASMRQIAFEVMTVLAKLNLEKPRE